MTKGTRTIVMLGKLFALVFILIACESEVDVSCNGQEGCNCLENSDCKDGLNCYDGKCIADSSGDGDIDSAMDSDGDSTETVENSESREADESECIHDEYVCYDNDIMKCSFGSWVLYRNCPDGTECQEGKCQAVETEDCIQGETACSENNIVRCGADLKWEVVKKCGDDLLCENSSCVSPPGAECVVGETCLERTHYCLADEVNGEAGHCVPFCQDSAESNCPVGWMCVDYMCEPIKGYCTSDKDCAVDSFCNKLENDDDGVCTKYCDLPGENCREGYECITDSSSADYGHCLPVDPPCVSCEADFECGEDFYCEIITGRVYGCCRNHCDSDDDCELPQTCNKYGRCEVGECPSWCGDGYGYLCDPVYGMCIPACPACGPNECCDATSAPYCYKCVCENPSVCGVNMPPCCFGYNCNTAIYGVMGYCI